MIKLIVKDSKELIIDTHLLKYFTALPVSLDAIKDYKYCQIENLNVDITSITRIVEFYKVFDMYCIYPMDFSAHVEIWRETCYRDSDKDFNSIDIVVKDLEVSSMLGCHESSYYYTLILKRYYQRKCSTQTQAVRPTPIHSNTVKLNIENG